MQWPLSVIDSHSDKVIGSHITKAFHYYFLNLYKLCLLFHFRCYALIGGKAIVLSVVEQTQKCVLLLRFH